MALEIKGPVFGPVPAPSLSATYDEQLDERDAYYTILKDTVKAAGDITPRIAAAVEVWWDEMRAAIPVECGGTMEGAG